MAFGEPDLNTLITNADPVHLVLRIDEQGRLQWKILGNQEGKTLAGSGMGYIIEIVSL